MGLLDSVEAAVAAAVEAARQAAEEAARRAAEEAAREAAEQQAQQQAAQQAQQAGPRALGGSGTTSNQPTMAFKDGFDAKAQNVSADAASGPNTIQATFTSAKIDDAAPPEDVSKTLQDKVHDAQKANDEYAKKQEELSEELSKTSGLLSPEQQKDYQTQFWQRPEAKDAKDKAASATDDVSNYLRDHGPELEKKALTDGDTAKALLQGNEALAKSPAHAQEAVDFAAKLGNPNNDILAHAIGQQADGGLEHELQENLLADAIPNVQANILAAAPDPAEAAARFEQSMSGLEHADGFKEIPKAIGEAVDNIKCIAKGDYSKLEKITQGWDQEGKFSHSLGVAGVVLGLYGAGKDFSEDKIPDGVKQVLSTTKSGLELTAQVVNSLATAEKVSAEAGVAVTKFAEHLAPVLGFAVDGIQSWQDINHLRDNGVSAADVTKLVGDAISFGGDVVDLVPGVGDAVGGLINAGGALVHGLGDFLDDPGRTGRMHDDEKAILGNMLNLSDDESDKLVGGINNPDIHDQIAQVQKLGLDPIDTREVLFNVLSRFGPDQTAGTPASALDNLTSLAQVYGISGHAFVNFVYNATHDDTDNLVSPAGTGIIQDYLHSPDFISKFHDAQKSGDFRALRQDLTQYIQQNLCADIPPALQSQLDAVTDLNQPPALPS